MSEEDPQEVLITDQPLLDKRRCTRDSALYQQLVRTAKERFPNIRPSEFYCACCGKNFLQGKYTTHQVAEHPNEGAVSSFTSGWIKGCILAIPHECRFCEFYSLRNEEYCSHMISFHHMDLTIGERIEFPLPTLCPYCDHRGIGSVVREHIVSSHHVDGNGNPLPEKTTCPSCLNEIPLADVNRHIGNHRQLLSHLWNASGRAPRRKLEYPDRVAIAETFPQWLIDMPIREAGGIDLVEELHLRSQRMMTQKMTKEQATVKFQSLADNIVASSDFIDERARQLQEILVKALERMYYRPKCPSKRRYRPVENGQIHPHPGESPKAGSTRSRSTRQLSIEDDQPREILYRSDIDIESGSVFELSACDFDDTSDHLL